MKRDAALARRLDEALPSPEPAPGADLRVLRRLEARIAADSTRAATLRSPWLARLSVAALAACVLTLVIGRRDSPGVLDESAAPLPAAEAPSAAASAPRSVVARDGDRLVVLSSGVRMLARQGARVSVRRHGAATRCDLAQGAVLIHVPPGTVGTFDVVTESTRVRVHGTVFAVDAGESGNGPRPLAEPSAVVTVWEGRVQIDSHGRRRELEAGEHWPPAGAAIAASEADFERLGARERVAEAAARQAEPVVGESLEPAVDEPVEPAEPRAADALVPTTAPRGASQSATDPGRAGGGRPPTIGSYRRAQKLEARGRRREAAGRYELSAMQPGPSAEAALFAAARLRLALGEPATAQHWLELYRQRHGEGTYARAVDVLLLRALAAQGQLAEVEREAQRFLRRFPTDPRARQFRRARALSRARAGRCATAWAEPGLSPDERRKVDEICAAR